MVFLVLHTTHNSQQSLLLVVIFLITLYPTPYTLYPGLRPALTTSPMPLFVLKVSVLYQK
jgi:hypothetical protein